MNVQLQNQFEFKPLTKNDLIFKLEWFHEPDINKWYAKNKTWTMPELEDWYLPRLHGKENIPSFIVYYKHLPIGFIQYYSLAEHLPDGMTAKDYQSHKLFKICTPCTLVGLDMYINNAARSQYGKGCGTALLSEFIATQIKIPFKYLVLDPARENLAAIKCYEKCGFKYFCTTYKSDGASVSIMLNL